MLYFYYYRPGSIATSKTEKALKDWTKMQMYRDLAAWGCFSSEKLDLHLLNIAMVYCMKKKGIIQIRSMLILPGYFNLVRCYRRVLPGGARFCWYYLTIARQVLNWFVYLRGKIPGLE